MLLVSKTIAFALLFCSLCDYVFGRALPVSPECIAINSVYVGTGTDITQCTLRYNPITQTTAAYWKILNCLSWSDAKEACKIGGAELASFPLVDDKFYLLRFISPIVNPHYPVNECYASKTGDRRNYGVWIGLSRTSSSSQEWNWEDQTVEQDSALPWDDVIGDYNGKNYLPGGNCGVAGWTTACCGSPEYALDMGYAAASCAVKAHSVCMKSLS